MSDSTQQISGVRQDLRTSNRAAKPTCHSLMVSRGANSCFFSSSDIGAASMKPRCRSCKESAYVRSVVTISRRLKRRRAAHDGGENHDGR